MGGTISVESTQGLRKSFYCFSTPRRSTPTENIRYSGKLSLTHSAPEDVKSLLQKICGFFAME
ncbi:MAG: hypothetical protein Q4B75_06860, partial [Eubacteriales bacterium]|nr:hypothetical protein [Eubacteriales bacterium]